MASFGVKYFETITASIVNWFSGNNSEITDFTIGSRIRTLFESVAVELEGLYYQVYLGVTSGIETAVYDSFSFTKIQSQAASGTVRFSRLTPAPVGGVTIPAGTQVGTAGTSTSAAMTYATIGDAVILQGQTYIDTTVVATVDGTIGNAAANTITVLIGSPSGVDSVTNPATFFTGRDVESNDERHARFLKYIDNLSRATLGAIENAALSVANVVDAVAYDSPRLSIFVFSSATSTFTDISFEANLPSGTPLRSLPSAVSLNDCLYIGNDSRFGMLQIDIETPMAGGAFIWEYFNGTAWVQLPVTSDSTSFLSQPGTLVFTKPSNWRDTVINDLRKFYIRMRVANAGVAQVATIVQLKAYPLPGVVALVVMDASASLPPSLQTDVSNAVEQYRAAGIRVSITGPTVTYVPVSVRLRIALGADPTAMQTTITQRITDFLSAFSLGRPLVISELIQFIENQSEDIQETILTTPAERVDVSFDEVLKPGAISVTVQQ